MSDIEYRLRLLLGEVKLNDSEYQEVTEFLEANEYELTLQTLVSILTDESKPISSAVINEIDRMAKEMQIQNEQIMSFLIVKKTVDSL